MSWTRTACVLSALLCATLPPGCGSTERAPAAPSLALFDGMTLDGWEAVGAEAWSARGGAIVCRSTGESQRLRCTEPLSDDFDLTLDAALIGPGRTDRLRIAFVDAEGKRAAVAVEGDRRNMIVLAKWIDDADEEGWPVGWHRGNRMRVGIEKGVWYGLRCTVRDGKLVVHHGDRHVETSFDAVAPVTLFLESHRKGAAFRGLTINQDAPAPGHAARSDDEEIVLFDGETMDGWRTNGTWYVEDGALVCPVTGQVGGGIQSDVLVTGPCEVSAEMQLIGRRIEDGRSFYVRDGDHRASARLDNSPNEFQLRVLPAQHNEQTFTELSEDEWYEVRLRVEADGTVRAWLDGEHELVSSWKGTFPARVGMTCQRSGARYRNITLRYLD